MAREQSSIGSSIYYGARSTDKDLGSSRGNAGSTEILTFKSTWDNIPAGSTTDEAVPFIPAGAIIVGCNVNVTTTITGATDYEVGGIDTAGGNADPNGFVTTTEAAPAVGNIIGAGAYIGNELQFDTQVTFTFTGTETAGEFEIRVEYYVLQKESDMTGELFPLIVV